MDTNDDFSSYYSSLISGRYDSVDRIVLDGYFILAQQAGGLRRWWRDLTGSDDTLDDDHLHGMAGTFSRRVHAHCAKSGIPVIHCPTGTDKHRLAESHLPTDPGFVGVFLVLVAKARRWYGRSSARGASTSIAASPGPTSTTTTSTSSIPNGGT